MQTIMIVPAGGNCNLNCVYCYHQMIREKSKMMTEDILNYIVPDRVAARNKIKFLWHGGEPLLAGMNFYRRAVELQKKFNRKNVKIINAVQTNAVLIDTEWAKFFAENDFKIGTSIDGPKHLHDKSRSNSFDDVMRGIQYIQKTGRDTGVVLTINKHNVDFPEEIWREIIEPKKITTYFEVSICSSTESSNLSPNSTKSFQFLAKLFDLWLTKDDSSIRIRTFRSILRFFLGSSTGDCAFEYNKCNQFAAIDEKGDVYVCNRFIKRDIAFLGNITENSLEKILSNEKAREMYRQIAGIKQECKNCEWLMCCGGGCAFQRWVHTGRFDAGFPECEIRKELFSYIREKIKR